MFCRDIHIKISGLIFLMPIEQPINSSLQILWNQVCHQNILKYIAVESVCSIILFCTDPENVSEQSRRSLCLMLHSIDIVCSMFWLCGSFHAETWSVL